MVSSITSIVPANDTQFLQVDILSIMQHLHKAMRGNGETKIAVTNGTSQSPRDGKTAQYIGFEFSCGHKYATSLEGAQVVIAVLKIDMQSAAEQGGAMSEYVDYVTTLIAGIQHLIDTVE